MQSIINMFRKYGITMYNIEMQSDSHVCQNNIVKTLRNSYVDGKDYTLVKEPNPVQRKYGSNNWSTVRMSPLCFKEFVIQKLGQAYLFQKNLLN